MKKGIALLVFLMGIISLSAEEKGLALGFGLSDSAGNFGINLEVSSPSFAGGFLQLTAESQLDYLSGYKDIPELAWQMFSSHRVGIRGIAGMSPQGAIQLYGEFGGLLVLPGELLSEDTLHMGIYGLFGFEFIIENSPVNYYLEAGSNGLFDSADNLTGNPNYLSGFLLKTGLRFYFR